MLEEGHKENIAAGSKDTPLGDTEVKYQYVWDLRYIDSPVLRDENTDIGTDNDCTDAGGSERLYYCNDANMNVTSVVQTDGTVAERYVYDAYGKPSIYNDTWGATKTWANSKKNEILFPGYRWDPETGLYHVRNRPYHPTLGRCPVRDFGGYVDGNSSAVCNDGGG